MEKPAVLLSPRLMAIADLVPKGKRVADIGTDHAYLCAYLCQKGISDELFASDIAKGPLKKAQNTVNALSLQDKIKVFLSDGLCGYEDIRPEVVVIAGMGGEMILSILENAKIDKTGVLFILQPMSMQSKLRLGLADAGYKIQNELIAREGGRFYQIMCAVYDGEKRNISPTEAEIGSDCGERIKDREFYDFVCDRIRIIEKAVIGKKKGFVHCEDDEKLLKELKAIVQNGGYYDDTQTV
ncbi:MAG: SAM-dependent methyltransferase [Clostridia bacterium]|nr:SAM-dependent methyltransferase [Clostridia bacterium]